MLDGNYCIIGPDFHYCRTIAGLLMWGALSDETKNPSFTIAVGPRQHSQFRVLVPWDSWTHKYCFRFKTSLFVASYASQGYGGGIRPPSTGDQPMSSQSQSYVTTDGQSVSLSWSKAPIWGLRPDFYYCQTVAGWLMWGALSDERTGLPFTIAAGICHRGTRDHILLYQIRDSPNREGQVPVFIFPRNRVAQLNPQALGWIFVSAHDSYGYINTWDQALSKGDKRKMC
jgi:hypothetical protein